MPVNVTQFPSEGLDMPTSIVVLFQSTDAISDLLPDAINDLHKT